MTIKTPFTTALDFTLAHEGGLVDDPDDTGGITKFGISLRFLRSLPDYKGDIDGDGDVDADDVIGLTKKEASSLYHKHFWIDQRLYELPPELATAQFDAAVNCGPKQAVSFLQTALADLSQPITIDGIMGPKTRAAVVAACKVHGEGFLALAVCRARMAFYVTLAAKEKYAKYLRGWIKRTLELSNLIAKGISYAEAEEDFA